MKVEIEQPVPTVEFRFNGHPVPIETPAPSAYTIIRLVPTDPTHRDLFPKVVDRAIGFIDRLTSNTDKIWLGNLLCSNFYQATNLVQVLVALDGDNKIVAHSVAYIESRPRLGNVVILGQIEKDEGGPDIIKLGFELIKAWSLSLGIKIILNESDCRAKARLWSRHGWYEYRITSRFDIE